MAKAPVWKTESTFAWCWKEIMMRNNTNQRRAEQLGMPYGTACGRLRKQVMLRLLQRLGADVCFRCGKIIESANDLSLDHKENWLDIDASKFWDLDNIAFSHWMCNTREKRPSKSKRISLPGMAWCSGCQDHVPLEKFGSSGKRTSTRASKRGIRYYCNDCRKKKGWEH